MTIIRVFAAVHERPDDLWAVGAGGEGEKGEFAVIADLGRVGDGGNLPGADGHRGEGVVAEGGDTGLAAQVARERVGQTTATVMGRSSWSHRAAA
ncbi:hypothetical protein [Spongiactinospora gelatinilytica]|uniref:hypothetical protein n=1 Tax=Spongiactinospora gelatinilytica TaxID=2666298 RepID=UPI001314FF6D|nr:hypothetical protein [Spongiactinospora gelatinilytica]